MRRFWLIGFVLITGCSGGRRMSMLPRTHPKTPPVPATSASKPLDLSRIAHEPGYQLPPSREEKSSVVAPANRSSASTSASAEPIIDSDMTPAEALDGAGAPDSVKQRQELVTVRYYSFDHRLHQGQILIDKSLADDVKAVFADIEDSKFPISRVIPISKYHWSDDASVAADNSSGFNYRTIPETHLLSNHALGRAIDLNPLENPYEDPRRGDDKTYDPSVSGALSRNSPPTLAFLKHGWSWGGTWRRDRDYQHFEKLR